MNEFIISTKGSLWESYCPEHKGERQGSRKGLRYNWDGVPFEEIEYRLDSPVIDEDIYSMSDEELLQFAEDHGLRPEMFTNELPDWAQRDGSRKGSRKGASVITSDNQFVDYFASLGYDPNWVRNHVLEEFKYDIHSGGLSTEEIDDYLSYAADEIPRKGSRKGSRKGEAGDTDQSQLFIYLYEQDTTDNNTLRNMWNSLSSDEQDYILFQFGESRQDFEESFN